MNNSPLLWEMLSKVRAGKQEQAYHTGKRS